MSVRGYLESVKERLLTDEIVVNFQIVRERETPEDGHLRARVSFTGGSQMEFSEYVQLPTGGAIEVVTYSYHWIDEQNNLILRWDNTPHHPNLAGFPHHIHDGASNQTVSGSPMDIFSVLDEIADYLAGDAL